MNNNPPIVTAILICMTDSEKPYLETAINSVINQSIPCKLRIYVEKSNQWVRDIIQSDSMITVRHVPLEPAGLIRNIGVHESDTVWVAYLDGDDIWMPNKIESQLEAATLNKSNLVSTDHYMIDEHGKLIACGLGGKNIPMTSSWMAKRDLFINHPFGAKLVGQDALWWRQSKEITTSFRVPSFLIKYRLRQVSASSDTPTKIRKMKILNASRVPTFRYLIIIGTWFANKLYSRKK